MVADINSVFALNDMTFVVFTNDGRFELWTIDSKEDKDAATLIDIQNLDFVQCIRDVSRIDDLFELDRHDTLKSRESLSESQVISDSETSEKIYHVAEMKNIYDDWLPKKGVLASDLERQNAMTSHHRFVISTGNELFIVKLTLNYNPSFQTIVFFSPNDRDAAVFVIVPKKHQKLPVFATYRLKDRW
jgi:hypothetical protein